MAVVQTQLVLQDFAKEMRASQQQINDVLSDIAREREEFRRAREKKPKKLKKRARR